MYMYHAPAIEPPPCDETCHICHPEVLPSPDKPPRYSKLYKDNEALSGGVSRLCYTHVGPCSHYWLTRGCLSLAVGLSQLRSPTCEVVEERP